MNTLIPIQASFQASRYLNMGHGSMFATAKHELAAHAASCCTSVLEQSSLSDDELPAGWQRDDAERILAHMARDLGDGVLMIVSPTPTQVQQIHDDGIELHHSRLALMLAAINHAYQDVNAIPEAAGAAFTTGLMMHQLRNGYLRVIKTN